MLFKKVFLFILCSILSESCSHLPFGDSHSQSTNQEDRNQESLLSTKTNKAQLKSTEKTINLELAKINSRISEIINEQRELKARLKLIERGLVLGITPDEISQDYESSLNSRAVDSNKGQTIRTEPIHLGSDSEESSTLELEVIDPDVLLSSNNENNTNENAVLPSEVKQPQKSSAEVETEYLKALATAQDSFASGNYGQAVSQFEQLASRFPSQSKEGNHLYWIGLSWMNLKEYDLAKKNFDHLVSLNPANPWIPRTMVHIAQMELRQGLPEQAIPRLKQVVERYPNEDASEMARAELSRYEKNL